MDIAIRTIHHRCWSYWGCPWAIHARIWLWLRCVRTLSGRMRSSTFCSLMWPGNGSCTRIPAIRDPSQRRVRGRREKGPFNQTFARSHGIEMRSGERWLTVHVGVGVELVHLGNQVLQFTYIATLAPAKPSHIGRQKWDTW